MDDAPPTDTCTGQPAVNQRDAWIQKWAIIAFAVVEAMVIAIVVIVRIRGG